MVSKLYLESINAVIADQSVEYLLFAKFSASLHPVCGIIGEELEA
jgi:hypothetical protein